jgi:hypothetical protein
MTRALERGGEELKRPKMNGRQEETGFWASKGRRRVQSTVPARRAKRPYCRRDPDRRQPLSCVRACVRQKEPAEPDSPSDPRPRLDPWSLSGRSERARPQLDRSARTRPVHRTWSVDERERRDPAQTYRGRGLRGVGGCVSKGSSEKSARVRSRLSGARSVPVVEDRLLHHPTQPGHGEDAARLPLDPRTLGPTAGELVRVREWIGKGNERVRGTHCSRRGSTWRSSGPNPTRPRGRCRSSTS